MKIFIYSLFLLFYSLPLFSNQSLYEYSDEPQKVKQKVLYISYENIPKRLIKGEKFSLTLKVLSTDTSFDDIVYKFENSYGCELLSTTPKRIFIKPYYFITFDFIATQEDLRTPDITLSLEFSKFYTTDSTTIRGKKIAVIILNTSNKFSNVIADDFFIKSYKTTSYDNKKNIVVFTAIAKNSNLKLLHFKDIEKQGIESLDINSSKATITYYAIIGKKIDTFDFTYYNLQEKKFKTVIIPILLDDDSVSTQSDLKPIENQQKVIKLIIASAIIFLAILTLILFKKYSLLTVIIPGIIYIIYNFIPLKTICTIKGTPMYLIPIEHATVMTILTEEDSFEVLNKVGDFYKVKYNQKIGWIKNENICSH